MHSNIGACALFGSVSGSSVATAATIGVVAMGEIEKHKYNERLFLGTLAAGGTLGILIPPSINMIIYGVMTDTSVPKLYLAGFIPGLHPDGAVQPDRAGRLPLEAALGRQQDRRRAGKRASGCCPTCCRRSCCCWSSSARSSSASPPRPKSAAVGIVGALAITAWRGRLTLRCCATSARHGATTAMVVAILVAAFFLNVVIQTIGLTRQLSRLITAYQLTPLQILIAVIALYLILGTFMEELSMMISTIPITTPLMLQAGYDPIWYGILIVLLIQTAMIRRPSASTCSSSRAFAGAARSVRRRTRLGAVRGRAADHDRDDLRLARDRDVAAARGSADDAHLPSSITIFPPASSSARGAGRNDAGRVVFLDDERAGAAAAQIGARGGPAFRASRARRRTRPGAAAVRLGLGPARRARSGARRRLRAGPSPTSWIATSSTGSSGPARWP